MKNTWEQIAQAGSQHIAALGRLQCFAEIARVGYEHAFLAFRIDPEKRINQQLADYILDQGEDFHELNQITALRCWAVVEAYIEDVCVAAAGAVDWQQPPDKCRKIRCDLHEILAVPQGDLSTLVVAKIADQVGSSLKQGIARFEALLDVFDLAGAVQEDVRREIYYLSKYRNCIMHNNGTIDRGLVAGIPVFAPKIGTRLGVTHVEARRFLFSCLWYILEVQRRCANRWNHILPVHFDEEQSRYVEWLRNDTIPESMIPFARPNLTFAKSVPPGSRVLVLGPTTGPDEKPQLGGEVPRRS